MLNGQKAWISNGGVAQFYVVFATVAPGTGHRGVTAFLLDRDDAGLSFGAPMRKMGQRAIVNTELFLQDCFVAEDRRLGEEGAGFRGLMATFDRSRVTLAAAATGLARAAPEYATAYAKERVQFGRPIAEHQAVAFRLADMALRVDAVAPAHLARRADARPRRARDDRGGDGQAARVRDRDGLHLGRRADARRLGLLARVPRREVDARRQARGDRGGHLGHPAPGHLARPAPSYGVQRTFEPLAHVGLEVGDQLLVVRDQAPLLDEAAAGAGLRALDQRGVLGADLGVELQEPAIQSSEASGAKK